MSKWPDLPKADPSEDKPENLNRRSRIAFQSIGWIVETVQTFNPHSGHNKDLFGFADLVMVIPGHPATVLVQVCGASDRSTRLKKILSNKIAYHYLTGKPHHHVWIDAWKRKPKGGWQNEITIVTTEDFDLCHIDCVQDVEPPDAPIDLLRVLDTAKSTTEK